jgi:hypothetical protein
MITGTPPAGGRGVSAAVIDEFLSLIQKSEEHWKWKSIRDSWMDQEAEFARCKLG